MRQLRRLSGLLFVFKSISELNENFIYYGIVEGCKKHKKGVKKWDF